MVSEASRAVDGSGITESVTAFKITDPVVPGDMKVDVTPIDWVVPDAVNVPMKNCLSLCVT